MTMTQNIFDETNPRRSLLFVPAVKLELIEKAIRSGADVICIDLEDSVSDKDKEAMRTEAISYIKKTDEKKSNNAQEIWLRINTLRTVAGLEDILALNKSEIFPHGLMLPKITSPEEVRILRDVISNQKPDVTLHPLIETSEGLKNAYEISKISHKIGSLVFGGFDMAANLRIEPSWNGLLFARQQLVLAAANAKIDLLDMPNFELDNLEDLENETTAARQIGFTGKCAIHPKQVSIINEIFSPSDQEIKKAENLIKKYEEQDKAFVKIDGILMEKPVLQRLYRTLAIAKRIES